MKVIMLTGKQGSGKSAVRSALFDALENLGKGPYPIKFADPLYEVCEMVYERLGLDKTQPHFKRLLQLVGTDWGRKAVDPDIWVEAARRKVSRAQDMGVELFIFDDCRFENELRAFSVTETTTVRLVAPEDVRRARADRWREDVNHPSEVGLDHLPDKEFDVLAVTDPASPGYMAPKEIAFAIIKGAGL